ncbi:MAG: protein-disulfide reductase DsbD [Hyphomicrobiaceae bacterium]|nr:protein-disulfide reductase DsbD [Hyphomicrobiaceae bacterium]
MRLFLLSLLFLSFFAAPLQASPLPADSAFQLTVSRNEDGSLRFDWSITNGYYLYREHISIKAADGRELPIETPAGERKDDPTFGPTEVYYGAATATTRATSDGPLELTYQGCQENGICYIPQIRLIDPVALAVSNPSEQVGSAGRAPSSGSGLPRAAAPEASYGSTPEIASTAAPAAGASTFNLASDDSLIQSIRSRGGTLLVVASFLFFGLLIAFTPCVLPLYPILAGVLVRGGGQLKPGRGFTLSSIYVLSFATAFALLGAVAGWSGQNLQMLLQSPVTTGAVALIFVVLALAMFGLFELQLPASWTNWIAQSTGALSISKRTVAVLGFSSALIIGPCVTAPLAGALLYIAQTGDMALGATALFALGIGKGIPLIALGTMGGSILPRAGAWMESVKRVFGLAFLATAIWMASPLLPAGLDLVFWSALLVGAGTWGLSSENATAHQRIPTRAFGTMALVYGTLLLIGAASGATDPLRPLAALASRSAPAVEKRELEFADVTSAPELQQFLQASKAAEPTLVYFTADWCITCRTIERSVLIDNQVRRGLDGFHLIKADLSDMDGDKIELMQQLKIAGPPTMVFFDRVAREPAGSRLVGNVTVEGLLQSAGFAGAPQK